MSASDRVRDNLHAEQVWLGRINHLIEEYRSLNRKHFNSAEMSDMVRLHKAHDALPDFHRMLEEEIEIIKRFGQRPAPFWSAIDE